MARQRLYGATQKKRKKKQTLTLKRQSSVDRVQTTHLPAPFQREGEVSGQDLAFMEAMRDMGVSRYPRSGEAPSRQAKFEAVRFAAEQEESAAFQQAMESLGVRSMDESATSGPAASGPAIRGRASRPRGQAMNRQAKNKQAINQEADASTGPSGRSIGHGAEPTGKTPSTAAQSVEGQGRLPIASNPDAPRDQGVAPKHRAGGEGAAPPSRGSAADFRWEEADAEMMDAVLEEGGFDPAQKFAGAPEQKPVRRQRQEAAPPAHEGREPDSELDLHGKTQEEAIRMVQNFLLTAYHRKLRHVLLITGKGLNSGQQGPVLREAVYHWLERNGERFAKSFSWAPPRHGGEGAIWVVLR